VAFGIADEFVRSVPLEWEVTAKARMSWVELIHRRAEYLASRIVDMLNGYVGQMGLQWKG